MNKVNQLTNNLFALDNVKFEQLEETVRKILRRYGFMETSHITVTDGGCPSGSMSRKGYYSPQLEMAAVVELSQDWDDYYNHENNQIEWREYHHYRVCLYDIPEPLNNDDLYFVGEYIKNKVFSYSRNNYNDLYAE